MTLKASKEHKNKEIINFLFFIFINYSFIWGHKCGLTFELPALQQRPRLLQREELLNGDKVIVDSRDLAVSWLSSRT